MGYERKRGKLTEFNALLRGGSRECFSEIVGDTSILPAIKYVITLDTDTQLPRDAARQLVGTMAHPLNRPQFDPVQGMVTEGYSILQPRVGVSLPSAGRSWFVRLFAGDVGIDPYTRAVSDVYQDVFQEGSFIGKGIYDVDAFQQAVAGRFPENTVLSHDLIESCHARSALVSDVEFYEEYPSRYNTDINRRHRWIRGDWQITQWLLPRVPGPDARRIANPLSGLSQWKIFDNLRRSLVPAALLLLLLGNWLLLPELGAIGPLLVLSIITLPGLVVGGRRAFPQAAGSVAGVAPARAGRLVRTPARPGLAHLRVPAVRRLYQPRCHRPDAGAVAVYSQTTPGMANRQRCRTHRPQRSRGILCDHVDRTGRRSGLWVFPGLDAARSVALAAPILGLWLAAPWIAWRISQPIEPSAVPELKTEAIGLSSAHGAQDLAFL